MTDRGFFAAVVRDSRPRDGGGMMMPTVEAFDGMASELAPDRPPSSPEPALHRGIASEAPPRRDGDIERSAPVLTPVSGTLATVPAALPESPPSIMPIGAEPVVSVPADSAPVFSSPLFSRAEAGPVTLDTTREGEPRASRERTAAPSPPVSSRRRAAASVPRVEAPRSVQSNESVQTARSDERSVASILPSVLPQSRAVSPSPGGGTEDAVPRADAERATLPISPLSAAAAREPAVVVEPPFVTPTRVVSSRNEPYYAAGAAQPGSREGTVPKSEGPRVHIGVVEVVIAAPAEKRAPTAAVPAPSSSLASRRYLRSL